MGIVPRREGAIGFEGGDRRARVEPDRAARHRYCPEERGIFSSLDVEENLLLPPVVRPAGLPSSRSSRSFRT
jgi:branched-chain amino acid transport system ATP-binding protein